MIAERQQGRFVGLRSVEERDAEFVLSLRLHPEFSRYLHSTSPSLVGQIEWIRRQRISDGDYYFVIETLSDQHKVGLIGLYNCIGTSGEFGRWICPFNSVWALESALLIYEFAFFLSFKKVYSYVLEQNLRSLNFYRRFGALETGPELREGFMQFKEEMTDELFHKVAPHNQVRLSLLAERKCMS